MPKTPANVQRGAAFLDERLPGWAEYVNPDTLSLAFDWRCVLGHVFGSYSKGEDVLGLTHADSVRLGFFRAARQEWGTLTDAWRRVVRDRRV